MLDSVGAGLLAGFIFGAGIAARGLREPGAARYEQIIVRETEERAAPLGDRAILAVVDEAGGAELSRDIGRDIEIEIAILRHGELALGHVDALAAEQTLPSCEPLVVAGSQQPPIARPTRNPR